jgi:hypothetical protein
MTSLLLLNHNLLIEKDYFITFMTTFGVLASTLSSICVITYLGPIHRQESISKDDWRRIYIICFSAMNILFLTISLLYDFKPYKIIILATVIVVIEYLQKIDDDELNKESKTQHFLLLRAWTDILCIILLVFLIFIQKKKFK